MRRFEAYSRELQEIEDYVRREVRDCSAIRVLEAGCGREWHLRPEGVRLEITGVDLDEAALNHRKHQQKDLDESVVGDLRTVSLPEMSYDIVYSSFVLEHIDGAEQALDNMVRALRPGGLLIVRVPDLSGVQTFLARKLPRWVAIAYYRHAWKIRQAGQPGFAPYPTHYDRVISITGFNEYCRSRGLTLIDQFGVGSYASRGTGMLSRIVPIAARIISVFSRGKIHDRHVDVTFIARKGGD